MSYRSTPPSSAAASKAALRVILLSCAAILPAGTWAAGEAALAPTLAQDGSGPVADLLTVCSDALRGNAKYLGALAEYRALKEQVPQARGKRLPQLRLFGDYSYFEESIDGTYFGVTGVDREDSFTRSAYGATVSQVLFGPEMLHGLDQSELRVSQAGHLLESAQGELLVGVAEAFFALLAHQGNLLLAQSKMNDLQQEYQQVRGRFEAGLATLADLKLAEAAFQVATADEAQAANAVVGRRARLTVMTGEQYGALRKLPVDIPLDAPDPPQEKVWIERTLARNPNILARRAGLEAAKLELKKVKLRRLPRLSAEGTAYLLDSDGGVEGKRNEMLERIGLRMVLPLYTGGQISSEVREAEAMVQRAEAQLQEARAQAVLQTRLAFINTNDGLKKVAALKRAVEAANAAVEATRGGFESGTRTYSEVLSSVERRHSAQTDYALARYNFVIDSLKLKQDAGILMTADLARINRLLESDGTPAAP